jgi:integrase/recombinase XerD
VEEITGITRVMVLSYEKYLAKRSDAAGKPMTRSRRGRYLSVMKMFFAHLVKEEKLYADPAAVVALPKTREEIVKDVLSVDEMECLLRMCSGHSVKGLRDRAVMELLYSAGLRADELIHVRLVDVDLAEKLVFIRQGKGGRERTVPFGESAKYWMERYLTRSRVCLIRPLPSGLEQEDHDRFFVSNWGLPLSCSALLRIVRRWVKSAGLEKRITTHTFRHSCASHMLRGKADIRYVQMQLGHRSIQTTERYLKIEISDLKEVHARTHPLERLS